MKQLALRLVEAVAGWEQPATVALSLALHQGEIIGLVGPNGVGKSTVLAAIAGRARFFSGRMEQAAGLRIVWQTQELPPLQGLPLNGRELLALTGAHSAGLPPWLQERLDWRLDRLSGGQRQYLALWAVMEAPGDLVLLDEPTNHLDVAGVRHLVSHLKHRASGGRAILLVSHDAEFVSSVCDRIITLRAEDV